jgi:hypothetical protein
VSLARDSISNHFIGKQKGAAEKKVEGRNEEMAGVAA